MKNHGKIIAAAGISLLLLCTGCGASAKNENINAGMEAIEALDYDGALVKFDDAVMAGESKRLLYRGQGLAYMGKTMYEEAVGAFEKSLSYSNGFIEAIDIDINYYLAVAYYKQGDIVKTLDSYDAIIAYDSSQADAYYLRGAVKAERNQLEEAQEDFARAMKLQPDNYDRLIDIYCVLEKNGYKDYGQEQLRAVIETDAKSMKNDVIGRMYYYLGDYDNARIYLEKAREGGTMQAILFLGKTYEALGDNNYAISVYNAFIEEDQTSARIYNQLGICKISMGEYEEALEAFQTGMKIEGNDLLQVLKMNEIVAYEYLGEYKKAAVLLDSYLKTYPDDETAAREYDFLKTR